MANTSRNPPAASSGATPGKEAPPRVTQANVPVVDPPKRKTNAEDASGGSSAAAISPSARAPNAPRS